MSYTSNISDVIQRAQAGLDKQVRYAASRALNAVAKDVVDHMHGSMSFTFDRVTPYALRSWEQPRNEWAKPDKLATIARLRPDAPAQGQTWQDSFAHLFKGGQRRTKRFEGAFRRIGALPAGYIMVPGKACPLDAYGNPRRAFLVQLISYFGGMSDSTQNMTTDRRLQLAKIGKKKGAPKTINGVQYFVSYGTRGKPGGDRYTSGRHDQHLAAGIWARSGTHGSTVKLIFGFYPAPVYRKFIDHEAEARQVVDRELPGHFDREFDHAMATARW